MSNLMDLIGEIKGSHFPNPPASGGQISAIEKKLGFELPGDLREFYSQCDGARLFKREDAPYWILPLDRLERTRVSITGEDDDQWGPPSWYSFCDVQDGNYLAIDIATLKEDKVQVIDCFHETFRDPGYNQVIALSFSEFLRDALKSGGEHYYLNEAFKGYGYRP